MGQLEIRTLLIIDDDPSVLEMLTELLKPCGIRILQAGGVTEARVILRNEEVTGILSDIHMPGLTGLQFLERLRADGNNTPMVLITAESNKENMHRAIQLGVVDFLEKPFISDQVQDVVFKLMEIGAQQHQINRLEASPDHYSTDFETAEINARAISKKSRLINLLRINLPKDS